jgi:hypothetical protein
VYIDNQLSIIGSKIFYLCEKDSLHAYTQCYIYTLHHSDNGIIIKDKQKQQPCNCQIRSINELGELGITISVLAGMHMSPFDRKIDIMKRDWGIHRISIPVASYYKDIVFYDGYDISVKKLIILKPTIISSNGDLSRLFLPEEMEKYEEIYNMISEIADNTEGVIK